MAKYKNKTKDCRLIVRAKLLSKEKVNERELEFFSQKDLRGFMKVRFVKRFGMASLEYTGPIGISLFERFKKPITRYDFFFIMEQIVNVTQSIQRGSLSLDKVLWDVNQIYINETTREVMFLYLPLEVSRSQANVLEFVRQMIYFMNPAPGQDSEYISRFTYFLKGQKEYNASGIEAYIAREDRTIVDTIKKYFSEQSGFFEGEYSAQGGQYCFEDEETGLLADEETGLLGEDEETGLLTEDEGTGLIQEEESECFPLLYRVLTEEKISIHKTVFRIGKEQSYADYFITDNNAVSRSHADIITRGKKHYVMDLNSKNKTYINGQPIPIQEEIEIFDGDKLCFANEEFVFTTAGT